MSHVVTINGKGIMSRLIFLTAATLLCLAIGCSDVTEPMEASYVVSLEKGNIWEYSVNGYEVDSGDTTIVTGTVTRTIVSVVTHTDGFQLFKTQEITTRIPADTLLSDTLFYYLRNESDELREYNDTTSAEYYVPFKYDPVVGNKWTPGSNPDEQIEVVSLYNSIDVPAGYYDNCACTRETDSSNPALMHRYYWGKHSEGIVCSVREESDSYLIYRLTDISIQ